MLLGGAAANTSAAENPSITSEEDTYQASVRSAAQNALLERRPLPVLNINMFSPVAFPGATPMAPAAGPPPTVEEVEQMLKIYMKIETPAVRKAALKLFRNPKAIRKIPNPSLRASLAGLMGTGGEPAIDYIMDAKTPAGKPKVRLIDFGNPAELVDFGNPANFSEIDPANALAFVNPITEQETIVFNPKNRSEYPFQFSSILAHETLHSDKRISTTEEIVANALHTSIYLEQLAEHPEMALPDTELTRRSNTNALLRWESGTDGKLRLFKSEHPNEQLLPDSVVPATTWFERFKDLPGQADTPGSKLLRSFLVEIARPDAKIPRKPGFNMKTLRFIDKNSDNLTSKELVKAGRALGVNFNG